MTRPASASGFLPVYTGPDDDEGVLHSGLAPYGDRLLTVAELEALAGTPPERGPNSQDFGYLVDPDGVLLEFNGNAETDDLFYGHLHFWHEAPLCAVNWYVEHLGARGHRARPVRCRARAGELSLVLSVGSVTTTDRDRPRRQHGVDVVHPASAATDGAVTGRMARWCHRGVRWWITWG